MSSYQAVNACTCVVLVAVLSLARPTQAENLCPPPTPPIAQSDDQRMAEEHFNAREVGKALQYFRDDLPRTLNENPKTEDVLRKESYAINYPNHIKTIQGYVLRQEASLRRAERDLTVERSQRGRASKADLAVTNTRFHEAEQQFCDFLKNAYYTD